MPHFVLSVGNVSVDIKITEMPMNIVAIATNSVATMWFSGRDKRFPALSLKG
jgi:hypothetical protein